MPLVNYVLVVFLMKLLPLRKKKLAGEGEVKTMKGSAALLTPGNYFCTFSRFYGY